MRLLATTLRHLERDRFHVSLLVLGQDTTLRDEFPSDVDIETLSGGPAPASRMAELAAILRAARRHDLIVAYAELTPTYLAAIASRMIGRPVVGWVHTDLSEIFRRRLRPAWAHSLAIRLFYPRLDAVVAVGERVAHDLAGAFGMPNVRHVANCIDIAANRRLASEADVAIGGPEDQPLLVAVGVLTHVKGFDTVIRAHARVRAAGIPHRLAIVGDGPLMAELRALAASEGVAESVQFLGFLKNPYAVMAKAQGLVLGSRLEGFALVVAEALALGVPVVATDTAGPNEILDGGRYGPLVPIDSPTAMAEALARLLTDPAWRAELARNAPEAAARYDARMVVPRIEAIFDEVLGAFGAGRPMRRRHAFGSARTGEQGPKARDGGDGLAGSLPAEIRFLLDVVAAEFGGPAPLAPPGLDWPSVLACVRHHRLEPLMGPTLAADGPVPEDVRRKLAAMMHAAAQRTLRLVAELAHLARRFAEAGVEVLAVKGPALSVLLHGDPARRSCRDIDLLVRPGQEAAARQVLAACGYGTTPEAVEPCRNAVRLAHARHDILVELHTRLADDDRLLPVAGLGAFETATEVVIAGTRIRTLGPDAAMAYAAYHGANHYWSRLYWLADFAAATTHPGVDWAEVARIAEHTGSGRQLAWAARLSSALLGRAPPLPPARGGDLAAIRRADAFIPEFLAVPPEPELETVRRLGYRRRLAVDLGLQSHWQGAWARLMVRLRPDGEDRSALPLPPGLGFMHYAVRPLRLLGSLPPFRRRAARSGPAARADRAAGPGR
ncbi:MAG TPA: nucleotidyltransferase family protein [Alphaproteobacteria bacterium]|nr:nucleotidyltransferase family protein [Alphaproteobacteria bacterium]